LYCFPEGLDPHNPDYRGKRPPITPKAKNIKSKKSKHKKLLEEKKRLFQCKGERIPPCQPLSFATTITLIAVIPEWFYQESEL